MKNVPKLGAFIPLIIIVKEAKQKGKNAEVNKMRNNKIKLNDSIH